MSRQTESDEAAISLSPMQKCEPPNFKNTEMEN